MTHRTNTDRLQAVTRAIRAGRPLITTPPSDDARALFHEEQNRHTLPTTAPDRPAPADRCRRRVAATP